MSEMPETPAEETFPPFLIVRMDFSPEGGWAASFAHPILGARQWVHKDLSEVFSSVRASSPGYEIDFWHGGDLHQMRRCLTESHDDAELGNRFSDLARKFALEGIPLRDTALLCGVEAGRATAWVKGGWLSRRGHEELLEMVLKAGVRDA